MRKTIFLIFCFIVLFNFSQFKFHSPILKESKSIIYFGDSIMDGAANNYISWDDYIVKEIPFNSSVNSAKSGATFSQSRIENMIITQILKHRKEYYDYVILQGGVNDAMDDVSIGKVSPSYNIKNFNLDTFAGSIDATFYYLTKYYNSSSIGIIITYDTPNAGNYPWPGKTSSSKEYFDILRQSCKKWHIPYIDFYNEYKVVDESLLLDGLHLNDAGYRKTTPYLIEFIQQLEPYTYNPNEVSEKSENRLIDFYHIKKETSLLKKFLLDNQ